VGGLLAQLWMIACIGLSPPVEGPVVAPFAPEGRFAGHWGVDFAVSPGTPVLGADGGVVSFAGEVAGMLSVNAATGAVWSHWWHGRFVSMLED